MLLKDICNSVSNSYNFVKNKKVIFLNTGDILNGCILHSTFSVPNILPGQAKKAILNDDILYSEIRPINRHFALVNVNNPNDYVVSTKLMVLRKFNNNYDIRFIYQYLSSPSVIQELQTIAESRSGTFPQITFFELGNIEIPNITLLEQQHIVNTRRIIA